MEVRQPDDSGRGSGQGMRGRADEPKRYIGLRYPESFVQKIRLAADSKNMRVARLSEASLRINESLDLDTVLQEEEDSARALTGSPYGVITTLDESGLPRDFVTSGMTPEAHRALENYLPDGLREPLRLRNYRGHIGSLGLSDFLPFSVSSFLTAPIRHAGRAVGNIYLAKQGPGDEFTQEDEETLVMFASQAALVIANARRHWSEQQARANLETLIDTSPVGVAVFDARTGAPISFNREAARIVGALQTQGRPPEQLLEVLTFRRADERERSPWMSSRWHRP